MKILMIAPEPFFQPRGTPISTYHRIKALTKLGYKIDLLTYHIGKNVKIKNTKIYRIGKIPFINKVKIGPSYAKFVLDFFLFLKAFSMCKKNSIDFIHTHEEASIMGIILKKLFKLPLVYDMHSSMPQQLVNYNFSENKILLKVFILLEESVIINSDGVIAISPHLEKIASYIKTKKTVLIENTATFNNKAAKKDILKLKSKLKLNNEKIILYTGTFEVNQGLDLLLKTIPIVVRANKNIKYIMVGGEKKQMESLKKLARQLNIDRYIIFTGQRPLNELSAYLELADILVSPRNKGTNTPLKIYSYLKSGKPIVATNIFSHTQVLNDKVAMLTKLEHKSFAKGIIKLLKNEKLRRKIGEEAKKLVELKYSYGTYVYKTKLIYDMARRQSGTL